MTTDTNKPATAAGPASEDCIDTALSTMQTALRAAWEGDYTKSARYVELTAIRLEARDQHNPAKWLRIALEEMQGKRQPVAVHAMSVPAPAVDERTNTGEFEPFFREDGTTFIDDLLKEDLAAASNGSPGGTAVVLHMTAVEAEAVHHALYLRLRALSMTEDHNPDPHRRREAVRVGDVVLRVADRLKELLP